MRCWGLSTTSQALALEGGRPVRDTLLPYGHHSIDADDIRAVAEVLRSDWLTTGPKVEAFEEAFAAFVGTRYAVAVSSGTAALHAAAFAAGLRSGDEAVTSPLTFAATANCILYQGARPVFADVRVDTLTLDPDRVGEALGPRTRAIISVDFAGQPADFDALTELAARHGIPLIDDAAHALGARYKGRPVGSQATMAVFSTHPVKHITSGEGGVVTTDDARIASRIRTFRNHGITSDSRQRQREETWFYEMVLLGYNYRLTDLQCALALSQLRKLPGWLARRRAIAARYDAAFAEIPEIAIPGRAPDREHAWHLYVIQLHLGRLSTGRGQLFAALRAENIGVNVHYIPVPWHPYYRELGYAKGGWPVAEAAYERILSLPIFPSMTDADVESVVAGVHKVISHFRC